MKLFTKLFIGFAVFYFGLNIAKAQWVDAIDSTIAIDDDFNYHFDFGEFGHDEFEDFDLLRYLYAGKMPRIDVNYSFNTPAIHSDYFDDKFAQTGGLEFTAGYTKNKLSKNNELIKSTFDYLRFAYYSPELGKEPTDLSKLKSEGWKFTWGDKTGYGWVFSESADLTLFHGDNFNWTRLDIDSAKKNPMQQGRLSRFDKEIKFGRSFEAGVNLRLWNQVGLSASYEQEHLFARHLFWYWAGSEVIEAAVTGLTSSFIHDITKRSKVAGPIINFIIRNGIAYGVYELRKKDMNWPFDTEAPMYIERFKLGINFTF